MTDDRTDELASAYLDGAASPDERAQVDADPGLLARVEELRAVAEALAAPVRVDPALRDLQLARALAAADPDAGGVEPAVASPLGSLDAARARRRRVDPGLLAGVAAAAVLLAVGATALLGGEASSKFDSVGNSISTAGGGGVAYESGADDLGPESAPVPPSTVPARPSTTTSPAPVMSGPPSSLFAFGEVDESELANALSSATQSAVTDRATASDSAMRFVHSNDVLDECYATLSAADPELGDLVVVAAYRADGEERVAWVFTVTAPNRNGPYRAYLVRRADCTVLHVTTF